MGILYDPERYKFPIPCNENLPKPSGANYEPQNVAWMIEMFAGVIGQDHTNIRFRYENNTCKDENSGAGDQDDIFVVHPDDKLYYPEATKCQPKSAEQIRYENAAKKSKRLAIFMEEVGVIDYFEDTCDVTN